MHDDHNDYPLAPERKLVTAEMLSPFAAAMQEQLNSMDHKLQTMGDLKWTLQELLKALGNSPTQTAPSGATASIGTSPKSNARTASDADEVKHNEKMLA